MRALLRPLAARAAGNPIEVIVAGFIFATLAYFHVLDAIRHSTFLSPSVPPALRPAHALLTGNTWAAVSSDVWDSSTDVNNRLELQQLVFGLDSSRGMSLKKSFAPDTTLADSAVKDALANATTQLSSLASHAFFTSGSRSATLTLALPSGSAHASTVASLKKGSSTSALKLTLESPPSAAELLRRGRWAAYALRALVLRFSELARAADSLDILLVLAGYVLMHVTFFRLVLAARALGSNFWLTAAILTSSTFAFVLALPVALHLGIPVDPVLLTEALPFLVCTVGFDKPLRLARAVFTHEHLYAPVSTSQTSSKSDGTITPGGPRSSRLAVQQTQTQTQKPAAAVLVEALDRVGNALLRDYLLEIFVLIVGASTRVGGLREMCAFAALILGLDCLSGVTFYVAVLGVMIEVKRIKYRRLHAQTHSTLPSRTASRMGSPTLKSKSSLPSIGNMFSSSSQDLITNSANASTTSIARPPSALKRRPSAKDEELRERSRFELAAYEKSQAQRQGQAQGQDPVARLKLLVIVSFVTLHVLNLCTTLTPATTIARIQGPTAQPSSVLSSSSHRAVYGIHGEHASSSPVDNYGRQIDDADTSGVTVHVVDIASPAVSGALDRLAAVVRHQQQQAANVENTSASAMAELPDVLVKIHAPLFVHVAPRTAKVLSSASQSAPQTQSHRSASVSNSGSLVGSSTAHTGTVGTWDAFLSAWTSLVGDPVLSKWISLALLLSLVLNAVLMRGIAAGTGLPLPVSWSAGLGVRFNAANLGVVPEAEEGSEEESSSSGSERTKEGLRRPSASFDLKGPNERRKASTMFGIGSTMAPIVRSETPKRQQSEPEEKADANRALLESSRTSVMTSNEPVTVSRMAVESPAPAPAPPSHSEPTLVRPQPVRPAQASSALALDLVDRKLNQVTAAVHNSFALAPSTNSLAPVPAPQRPREPTRSYEECLEIFEHGPRPVSVSLALLNDEEIILLSQRGKIQAYALEKLIGDYTRAVRVRRALVSRASRTQTLEDSDVPFENYAYERVFGACCENVVGYIPVPFGIAGPLNIDGEATPIPMATAEGTLVASTSRGCKALNAGGGVSTVVTRDAMTRGPAIDFPSVIEAAAALAFIESDEGDAILKSAFESTSRFARLARVKCALAGRTLFVRFATRTGDAMGMNMISKGTEAALKELTARFPSMKVLALSGNYCTDKKPAAINWIEGRGKSVVAEAIIPGKVVESVLKTTVQDLCELNIKKNLIGSAMAGSIGGFNAHAANILTAVFLATGQDPAQNVESSNCMTLMEPTNNGADLRMTVTMPSIEVGTVGGGTVLAPQSAVLDMLGLRGAHQTTPGANAQRLARVIAAAVMAGELSLMAALAAGHLIRAHMAHNRSQLNTPATSRPVTPGPDTESKTFELESKSTVLESESVQAQADEARRKAVATPAPAALGIATPLAPYSGIHTPAPERAAREVVADAEAEARATAEAVRRQLEEKVEPSQQGESNDDTKADVEAETKPKPEPESESAHQPSTLSRAESDASLPAYSPRAGKDEDEKDEKPTAASSSSNTDTDSN